MRALIISFFMAGYLSAQVSFNFDSVGVDCHQSMISLTVIDSGYTEGDFTLQYLDGLWQDCTLPWQVVLQPDTFYILYSGMGTELHTYDSLRVVYKHYPTASSWPVLYLNNPCVNLSIEPIKLEEQPIIEYYNLSGQKILVPKGLYIEVKIFKIHQTVLKKYEGAGQ